MRALAVLLFWLAAMPAPSAFDPFSEARIEQRPGAQLPLETTFRDENGGSVVLGSLAEGKPMLLAPVVHNCPNMCGVTLSGLAEAVLAQPLRAGADFAIVALGIDPREGPAEASESLAELRERFPALAPGAIHALTGAPEQIAALTNAMGYRYGWDERLGQYAHAAAVAVVTPDGRLSRWLYGLAPDPGDLRLALAEAGGGKLGSWREQFLLLCYRYDPQTGRYEPLVWLLLRIGAGATAGIGALLIASAVVRERRAAKRVGP